MTGWLGNSGSGVLGGLIAAGMLLFFAERRARRRARRVRQLLIIARDLESRISGLVLTQSADYVPGISGWRVCTDGTAEFNGLDATAASWRRTEDLAWERLLDQLQAGLTAYPGPAGSGPDGVKPDLTPPLTWENVGRKARLNPESPEGATPDA